MFFCVHGAWDRFGGVIFFLSKSLFLVRRRAPRVNTLNPFPTLFFFPFNFKE